MAGGDPAKLHRSDPALLRRPLRGRLGMSKSRMSKSAPRLVNGRSDPVARSMSQRFLCCISPRRSMSDFPPARMAMCRAPRVRVMAGRVCGAAAAVTTFTENVVPMSGPEYTTKPPSGDHAGSTECSSTKRAGGHHRAARGREAARRDRLRRLSR
jgi:hypothetical protein